MWYSLLSNNIWKVLLFFYLFWEFYFINKFIKAPKPECNAVCDEPICDWKCAKPDCPKPKCELVCENPSCKPKVKNCCNCQDG